ncbi:MAG: GNAT family N-acetyltransferase [Lachnospiraceae bacterium]
MIIINPSQYHKVSPLFSSNNSLASLSTLDNIVKGSVYVDNENQPTCVLIKTPVENYIAGNPQNKFFTNEVSNVLDFWDRLTPDTEQWEEIIPQCHPNKYIRKYKRCRYQLTKDNWENPALPIPQDFEIEKVNLANLQVKKYKNSDVIYDWISDYGNDYFTERSRLLY